jgi:hypothetical protein
MTEINTRGAHRCDDGLKPQRPGLTATITEELGHPWFGVPDPILRCVGFVVGCRHWFGPLQGPALLV